MNTTQNTFSVTTLPSMFPSTFSSMLRAALGAVVLGLALVGAPRAHAEDAAPQAPQKDPVLCEPLPCDPPPDGCPCPTICIADPLFRLPCIDDCIDSFKKGKAESCFKLGAGAYHWIHLRNEDSELTYGYPDGGEGTYFYYVNADLECKSCGPCGPTFGAHAQLRARDETVFRSFFDEQVWFYEAYAWLDVPRWGRFKAGKVWKRFGFDWDGTFWGNVPYYDGMKLDPDWGVSWEQVWRKGNRFEVDTFLQVFFAEDEVNGSIAGGDSESTDVLDETLSVVARVVPRYRFNKNTSVSLGLSALAGTLERNVGGGQDEDLVQFAADVEFRWCGLRAFAEFAHSDGVKNPTHYVTGGPSDVADIFTVGVEYKIGPFTPRVVFSHGEYENPGGEQDLLLAGGTIALTHWLTFYFEYVDWTVQAAAGAEVEFEKGFQFVFAWDV